MFSTAARFDGGRVSAQTTIRRNGGILNKSVRRLSGTPLKAAAPRRLRLRCTVESDLTQNAPADPTLLQENEETAEQDPPQEPTQPTVESPEPVEETALKPGPMLQNALDDEKDDAFALSRRDLKRADQMRSQEIQWKLKVKQEVLIRVTRIRALGASVDLLDHRPCQAFLPIAFFPTKLQDAVPSGSDSSIPPQKRIEKGIERKAVVVDLTPDVRDYKGGVVVSCMHFDQNILFRRLIQLRNLCTERGQSLKGHVIQRVFRGLLVLVAGFVCFLPSTHYGRQATEIRQARKEEFQSHYKNSLIDVVILEIERDRSRVIVSNKIAENMKALRTVRIGSLIYGRIVNVKPYGVFVTLNDTQRTGLLHVSNMSKVHVRSPEEVFEYGEMIYAVVLDMDPENQKYALSTADLEETRGEILYNKEAVMQNAPAMAARLQKELESAREARLSENAGQEQ